MRKAKESSLNQVTQASSMMEHSSMISKMVKEKKCGTMVAPIIKVSSKMERKDQKGS